MIFPLTNIAGHPLTSIILILIPILVGEYISKFDIPDIYAYLIYGILGYLIILSAINLITMYGKITHVI